MDDITERIKCVFELFKTNPNKLAGGDGALQRKIARQSNGATVTFDVLELILKKCQGLSVDWLILGQGDMLKSVNNQEVNGGNNITVGGNASHVTCSPDLNEKVLKMLEEKDRQIAEKDRQIAEKDRQIANLFAILSKKSCLS